MKRRLLLSALLLTAICLVNPLSQTLNAQDKKPMKEMAAKKYYCSHHPDQLSDKPGKCPVCGMALVEMKSTDKMQDAKSMKMDNMKGDMKKMDGSKMMKDSKGMKMEMKDSTKMKMEKMK